MICAAQPPNQALEPAGAGRRGCDRRGVAVVAVAELES